MKKYIVITTINPITLGVKSLLDNDFNLVIVGDQKTPNKYQDSSGIFFLDIATQKELFPDLADLIPYNHYCRKNLGYLYAVSQGADLILDTDDDNIFDRGSLSMLDRNVRGVLVKSKTKWANVYSLFSQSTVWPRGLPLDEIHSSGIITGETVHRFCPIQQYLVDEDPDVDAVFRLVFNRESVLFDKEKDDVILTKGTWCPFNSQATVFFKEAFPLLYLPTSVASRVTDIWRSFLAQAALWQHGYEVAFRKPIARQERNFHNLLDDFKEEFSGFVQNRDLIERLELSGSDLIENSTLLGDTALHYLTVMVKEGFLEREENLSSKLWHKALNEAISKSSTIN